MSRCCCMTVCSLKGDTDNMPDENTSRNIDWWAKQWPWLTYLNMGDWKSTAFKKPPQHRWQLLKDVFLQFTRGFTLSLTAFITVRRSRVSLVIFGAPWAFQVYLAPLDVWASGFPLPTRSECFNLEEKATKHALWNTVKHCPSEYTDPPFQNF